MQDLISKIETEFSAELAKAEESSKLQTLQKDENPLEEKKEEKKEEPKKEEEKKEKPASQQVQFQLQVRYRGDDGKGSLCVLTKTMATEHDRDIVEANLNSAVVSLHAVHTSALLAQRGDYLGARMNLIGVQRLLQRGMKKKEDQKSYIHFIKQSERLDGFMREAASQEQVFQGGGAVNTNKSRAMARDDTSARNIVQMKRVPLSAFRT